MSSGERPVAFQVVSLGQFCSMAILVWYNIIWYGMAISFMVGHDMAGMIEVQESIAWCELVCMVWQYGGISSYEVGQHCMLSMVQVQPALLDDMVVAPDLSSKPLLYRLVPYHAGPYYAIPNLNSKPYHTIQYHVGPNLSSKQRSVRHHLHHTRHYNLHHPQSSLNFSLSPFQVPFFQIFIPNALWRKP